MTNTQPQFDVFLAHNSLDKPYVRNIYRKLKRSRLKPWLDEEEILGGQIIQDEIQKVIIQIKTAAIFIGTHGLGNWQTVELRSFITQCVKKGVIVIPVLLPGVSEIPEKLVFLREHKWVSFANGIEDKKALEDLKSAIRQRKQTRKPTKPNKQPTLVNQPPKKPTSHKDRPDLINAADSYLIPKPSVIASKTKNNKVSSTTNANLKSSIAEVSSRKKTNLTSTQKNRKLKSDPTRARKSVSSSGAWVLLDNKFFLTESVETQVDQSVILHILSADPEQQAALRNLQPEQYNKKQISYAYQNEAAIMQVESVLLKSIKGKNTFMLTLKPYQQAQGYSMIEMSFNGYSADEIAKLRARFLLLNELPPASQRGHEYSMLDSFIKGYDNPVKVEKCVFFDLWTRLKKEPQLFLTHARLAAVYHLKMSRTVEHILELKLTLIKNNLISVQFRGQRKQVYVNQQPAVIEVKGNCVLNT